MLSRRRFIEGLVLLGAGCASIDLKDKTDYVHMADIRSEYKDDVVNNQGLGIIRNGKYITMSHIINSSEKRDIRTPIGWYTQFRELVNREVRLYDTPLKQLSNDRETDISIFELPEQLRAREMNMRRAEPELGEEVFIVGNPYLQGYNIRRGYVTDLDGPNRESKLFGTDIHVLPGDSGGPCFSKRGLLGLVELDFSGFGYVNRLEGIE